MRYVKAFLVVVLVCSLVVPGYAANKVKTSQEIKAIADPILDNILDGFRLDEYLRYSRDFDPALKVVGARTQFFKVSRYMQRVLGGYVSREYMGTLRKGDVVVVLWKGTFDKTSDNVLIKLVLSEKKNRYRVTGLWLQ
ncbi:MAG: hypothetical protein PHO30_00680 [Candidatus Omnitrophica bacterium]|nr:hypothetical protein [Candidatus Omnitrophota bacterium]